MPRARLRRTPHLAAALFALAVLALAAPRASAAEPLDATTRDFDQLHLIVRVTPHVEEGTVDSETTIRFASMASSLKVLRLHCQETSVISAKDGEGTPLEFSLADNILSITLAKSVVRDAQAEVTIRSRSKPTAGLYFHAPSKTCPDMPLEMYSQGEGDDNRRWFPCYDEPDDRATCEVFVTIAADLKSISNGVLVESKPLDDGKRREDHWKLDQRIPTYLVSLIVGKFTTLTDTWKDVPLEYNGQVGRDEEIKQGFSATKAIMDFFSEYTGRHFPYPRYAQTTVWDFVFGGMENAGATTMNMRLLHPAEVRPNYSPDGLVAHEMAHQWFGDLLTCKTFDHIWLNEGFATYFTDLFFEHRDGPDQFALERFFQNRGYFDANKNPETLGLTASPRGDLPLELHGGKQYNRGAAILHQLRIELGDDLFRKSMARWVKDYEDKAVVSEDLRHAIEVEAGTSLKWFFDEWVYGAGYPVLAVSYSIESVTTPAPDGKSSTTGKVAHVTIDQTQAAGSGQTETFRITVPYRFGAGDGAVRGRFDVRRRHQVFDVPLAPVGDGAFLRVGDGGGTFARCKVNQGLDAWRAALAHDTDPAGRIEAAEALADWPDGGFPALAAALAADKVYAVRTACAKTMAPLVRTTEQAAALAVGLKDADARVREATVEAMGGLTRDIAGAFATEAAKKDPNPYVRSAAAIAVGRLHAEGAFETLQELLAVHSHREIVKKGAFDGLTALGDPRALPLAAAALPYNYCQGDHHGMRQAALNCLVALAPDTPETHTAIVERLDDEFYRMRSWAAEAAGKLLIRSAKARLEQMAANDPDGGAKAAAKTALDKLTKK
jgi:aminopeptidase N